MTTIKVKLERSLFQIFNSLVFLLHIESIYVFGFWAYLWVILLHKDTRLCCGLFFMIIQYFCVCSMAGSNNW